MLVEHDHYFLVFTNSNIGTISSYEELHSFISDDSPNNIALEASTIIAKQPQEMPYRYFSSRQIER